jgi:hypothetical protein
MPILASNSIIEYDSVMNRPVIPEGFPAFSSDNFFYLSVEAAAAFRFRKDGPLILRMPTDFGRTDISIGTEYAEMSGLPRTIISVKIFANGKEINQVGMMWLNHVAGILNAISVATNAAIIDVEPLYLVDISKGRKNRPFYQNESTLPRPNIPSETRLVDAEAAGELASLLLNEFDDRDRLLRAINQYVLALRYATPSTKTMAVVHAFMAAETLVPIAKQYLQKSKGITLEELAKLGAEENGWKHTSKRSSDLNSAADSYTRKTVIFHGDKPVHRKTKYLSDGFEHGFGKFEDIIKSADEVYEPAMSHIRRAIIELSPLEERLKTRLIEEPRFSKPLGIYSHRTLTSTLLDEPGDDEITPPIELDQSGPDVQYNEETGEYKFDVRHHITARRNVGTVTLTARP